MRFSSVLVGLLAFSLPFICAQDDSEDTPSKKGKASDEEPGPAATTDTTLIAGTFEVNYFSNSSTTKGSKQFLPCGPSKKFQLTFPSGENGEITRDTSNFSGGKDPIYSSSLGNWKVMEFTKVKSWYLLKSEVLISDIDDPTIVCWLVRYDPKKKKIDIDINPAKPDVCPSKTAEYTSGCLFDHTYISGTCIEGPCMGEESKSKEKKDSKDDKGKDKSSAFSLATSNLLLASLALYISI